MKVWENNTLGSPLPIWMSRRPSLGVLTISARGRDDRYGVAVYGSDVEKFSTFSKLVIRFSFGARKLNVLVTAKVLNMMEGKSYIQIIVVRGGLLLGCITGNYKLRMLRLKTDFKRLSVRFVPESGTL